MKFKKCKEICRTYDSVQKAFTNVLQTDESITEIRCNVLLDGVSAGEYTTDFVFIKANNILMVRECLFKKHLTKPQTVKLLDISRNYWLNHGVTDWGLVI